MATLELPVSTDWHVTLAHFEYFDEAAHDKVVDVMAGIMAKIKKGPSGVFGERAMMGRFKNVKAIMVDSLWVQQVAAEIDQQCRDRYMYPSGDFRFTPHVSRPPEESVGGWSLGDEIPFGTYIQLLWRPAPKADKMSTMFDVNP